jgi:GxxExxY protein
MKQNRQDRDRAAEPLVEQRLTGQIIACFFTVYNTFGLGMLEGVYRNALAVELSRHGLIPRTEVPIEVVYRGVDVGFFRIDLLVEGKVAVEVKATELLAPVAKRQLLNYLRVSNLDVGLLLHFGLTPRFHRLVSPRVLGTREEQILPVP